MNYKKGLNHIKQENQKIRQRNDALRMEKKIGNLGMVSYT